ncbi:MAG: PepSY domain-containing protein, partial [Phenylobacterium sp.]|nr:PepSY domain-containing protein [Phenylobacterium sp.]
MSAMTEPGSLHGAERKAILAHRTVWRWHFYAGLFCIPFVIVLSLTGAAYLFKPQVEAFLDRPFDHLVMEGGPRSAQAQVDAALAAAPEGSRLRFYEVRSRPGDAARITLSTPDGPLIAFVHPEANVVLSLQRETDRPMEVIKTIHGELLMGERGSLLVELAAGWAMVMILTGLVLWFPRGGREPGGVLWPRLGLGGRLAWRGLHAVTGFWVSGIALFLLLTGLPWTTVWNDAFKEVRRVTGTLAAS